LQKELADLQKQVKTMDSMLNGYQRENERMVTKENMQKKEIEKYQTELQEELKRNQQLQQQLLRKGNQVLISDDTIDLNKTNVSNLIFGGEIIDVNELSELKNKNKYLNENLMKTINENKQFKEREIELNDTMTK
jgi:hypothetical protein